MNELLVYMNKIKENSEFTLEQFKSIETRFNNLPCNKGSERIDKLEEDIKGLRMVNIELQKQIEELKSNE